MKDFPHSIPVLSCAEAKLFEKEFFARPGAVSEEAAMNAAGIGVADGVLRVVASASVEHSSAAPTPIQRLLVLAGKGHNGGDAVRAAERIFSQTACRVALVFFARREDSLAPLTRKFLESFFAVVPAGKRSLHFLPSDVPADEISELPAELAAFASAPHLVVLDGIYGHSFHPPFPPAIRVVVEKILARRAPDSLVCSVDLPSGLCDASRARAATPANPNTEPNAEPAAEANADAENFVVPADATFPTGILKRPLLAFPRLVGRLCPIDLGFRGSASKSVAVRAEAVADEAFFLKRIFAARPVVCDKRDFGHVLVVGGSRSMSGALLLNVLAALGAGAGLVSVICPERVQAAFAARAPGAMWIPCRENSDGGLDCDAAFAEFEKILPRVSVVLCGSGAGISADTQALIQKIAAGTPKNIPLVLDADALRAGTLDAVRRRGAPSEKTILLPHAGEFARLCVRDGELPGFSSAAASASSVASVAPNASAASAVPASAVGSAAAVAPKVAGSGDADALREFCRENAVTVALKGVCTRVAGPGAEFLTFSGTPALARGGSGDVLAGTVAALFASPKNFPAGTAEERLAAAVIWHGNAARRLAAVRGERCADVALLPEFLARANGNAG